MSNYTKTTNFAAKDSLPSGNANKIVKGTEIDTEFDNIATASATKANIASPTFTGTVTIPTVDLNGGAIDGTTVGASTAAAITGTTIVANTSINIAGDGATVTGIKDEDDMSSNSATKLATQQSIKAYVDSQVTAQDLDFQADSGGALSIDLDSETLTFTGGTGVDTSGSGNAVTFAIDSTVTTLTGTQTLTNKTLTSPTLNTPTIGTSFTIGSATITEAELEILDGATVTTAELNVLDGITSTTAELNILDGVTSTAAELNILDGVTSTAAELNILDGVTSTTAELNILDGVTSSTAELNILDGVTSTTAELNILDGVTASTAELNIMDGVTSTTAELNILDGVTATTAELNYVDGVTSAIQTQLNAKAPLASPTFTGSFTSPGIDDNADAIAITIDSSENVGIGTSSPARKLTIQGGSGDTLPVRVIGGSGTTTGGIEFQDASTTADYKVQIGSIGDNLYLRAGGAEHMRITSTGNVGIGTSSPTKTLVVNENDSECVVVIKSSDTGSAGVYLGGQSDEIKAGMILDNSTNALILRGYNNAERMRIDSSGNVGIGITSGLEKFTVVNASSGIVGRFTNNTNQTLDLGVISGSGAAGGVYYNSANSGYHAFQVGGTERLRIDSSGNVLVGKTTADNTTAGTTIYGAVAKGAASFVRDAGNTLVLNRLTSDGEILAFRKDGTNVGSIGSTSPALYIGSGDVGVRFDGANDRIRPVGNASNLESIRDNAIDLGDPAARFDDIYATNGTIQTSDRNEKQDIEALSDAEQRVAVAAKGLLRKFRWISSVEENGDDARIHFGIIAQDLQAAFTAEGLDAGRYAMFISSTWTDEETGEERTRLGVRYSELLAFIISAI